MTLVSRLRGPGTMDKITIMGERERKMEKVRQGPNRERERDRGKRWRSGEKGEERRGGKRGEKTNNLQRLMNLNGFRLLSTDMLEARRLWKGAFNILNETIPNVECHNQQNRQSGVRIK